MLWLAPKPICFLIEYRWSLGPPILLDFGLVVSATKVEAEMTAFANISLGPPPPILLDIGLAVSAALVYVYSSEPNLKQR
jgi:hypothetical protein